MKSCFILIFFFVFGNYIHGQRWSHYGIDLDKDDKKLINSNSADSLISRGEYYQVFFSVCDFRKEYCTDSLSVKFNFKPYWLHSGCELFASDVFDTIDAFNNLMDDALVKVNGPNWREEFEREDSICIQCLCSIGDNYSRYIRNGIGCAASYMFQQGQVELDSTQKCIISHHLLKILKALPEIGIVLEGHSSINEEDSLQSISRIRAQNVYNFLITQGVSPDRLRVEWHGTDQPLGIIDKFQDHNRRVSLVVFHLK